MRFDDIDIVGFHGQTVLHRPEKKLTVQIGDAPRSPRRSTFRSCTISAPPTSKPAGRARRSCRSITARSPNRWIWEGPIVVVNIGGVANITYIDGDTLIACDTGPGNALLDDYMFRWLNQRFDTEGRTAAHGQGRCGLDQPRAADAVLFAAAAEIARPQRFCRR